jgi:hypothetical protein
MVISAAGDSLELGLLVRNALAFILSHGSDTSNG